MYRGIHVRYDYISEQTDIYSGSKTGDDVRGPDLILPEDNFRGNREGRKNVSDDSELGTAYSPWGL